MEINFVVLKEYYMETLSGTNGITGWAITSYILIFLNDQLCSIKAKSIPLILNRPSFEKWKPFWFK